MQQVSKNKKVDSITEIEHASIDFNVLNYLEETVNTYNTGDESERKSDFFADISNYDSSRTEIFPVKYVCSTTVPKNTQFWLVARRNLENLISAPIWACSVLIWVTYIII